MRLSDKRGGVPWHSLEPGPPHVRWIGGDPIVVLTAPAHCALCVEPDGRVTVRRLTGVRALSHSEEQLTLAQERALHDLGIDPRDVAWPPRP